MGGGSTDWDAAARTVRAITNRDLAAPPDIPRFEGGRHTLRREPDEQLVRALPAANVRYRMPAGANYVRWGPLMMRLTLTSHRVVLSAIGGAERAADWSDAPDGAPLVFHTIEPAGSRRGLEPVRVVGQVAWERVSRVDGEGSRILILMPVPIGVASLTLHVPSQLGHRVVAAARAAFLCEGRVPAVDTPFRVDAGPARREPDA